MVWVIIGSDGMNNICGSIFDIALLPNQTLIWKWSVYFLWQNNFKGSHTLQSAIFQGLAINQIVSISTGWSSDVSLIPKKQRQHNVTVRVYDIVLLSWFPGAPLTFHDTIQVSSYKAIWNWAFPFLFFL